jgi:SAM-dependent methyltransferase
MVLSAEQINLPDDTIDVIVSGLVLNFVTEIKKAMAEFKRIAKAGGTVSAYVWDYAEKMEMLRYFWDAAISLFEDAIEKDEGVRFPICNSNSLYNIFNEAGFRNIEITSIDVPAVFKNFDDYWTPFLSGIGPAPGYCMALTEEKKLLLKEKLESSLPIKEVGSIELINRAIGIKCMK